MVAKNKISDKKNQIIIGAIILGTMFPFMFLGFHIADKIDPPQHINQVKSVVNRSTLNLTVGMLCFIIGFIIMIYLINKFITKIRKQTGCECPSCGFQFTDQNIGKAVKDLKCSKCSFVFHNIDV